MTPYPAYKPSGVPWLGDVPEHWDCKRLKYHAPQVVDQRNYRLDGEKYVALEHIESWTGKLIAANEEIVFESTVKAFSKGDVLFSKLRPYLAKAFVAHQNGVCVGELLVLRPKPEMLPRYLLYNLLTKSIIDVINGSTYGAKMPRASWDFVGNLSFYLPPTNEQSAIVA